MNALHLRLATLTSLLLCSIAGCTWVPLTTSGQSVQVMPTTSNVTSHMASDIENCDRVGAVTAQTRSRIGIFARGQKKVVEELQTLARNDAAEMGADHVIADGPPSAEGRQRFSAYRCAPAPR